MFSIEPTLGHLTVARELDINHYPEFTLSVKATDKGIPPLSATVPVHIMVTMADNAPPRYVLLNLPFIQATRQFLNCCSVILSFDV